MELLKYLARRAYSKQTIECGYINHRGNFSRRRISPITLWYGQTKWHPQDQWLLDGIDLDLLAENKEAFRSFAVSEIGIDPEDLRNELAKGS